MNKEISELLKHYENGLFTRPEIITRLVHSCVEIEPQEYVPYLSEDFVLEMKQFVQHLPKTVSEIFFLGGGAYGTQRTDLEVELSRELEKVRAFGAAWRMDAYFRNA